MRNYREYSKLRRKSGQNGDNLFELRDANFKVIGVNTWSLKYIRNLKKDFEDEGLLSLFIYQIRENGLIVFNEVH